MYSYSILFPEPKQCDRHDEGFLEVILSAYIMLCLFVFGTFILPLAYSNNLIPPTLKNDSSVPSHMGSYEKTNLSLASEGGTVIASTPDLSLPKDKQQTDLLTLDKELKTHKEKSVTARKGVDIFTNTSKPVSTELQNGTETQKIDNSKNESHLPPTSKLIANVNAMNTSTMNISKPISTEVPKKPKVLSYEALINADKNIEDKLKNLDTNPSLKTLPNLAKSQIPSPNDDNVVKVYPSKANSHPGMIMPIVITILVVPMFALVGYMALKRGKEAWKNRHYKRMDFLLDGMYND